MPIPKTAPTRAVHVPCSASTPRTIPDDAPFDVVLIPHPQEATLHLFPRVTVTTDDGRKVRSETRAALLFP